MSQRLEKVAEAKGWQGTKSISTQAADAENKFCFFHSFKIKCSVSSMAIFAASWATDLTLNSSFSSGYLQEDRNHPEGLGPSRAHIDIFHLCPQLLISSFLLSVPPSLPLGLVPSESSL